MDGDVFLILINDYGHDVQIGSRLLPTYFQGIMPASSKLAQGVLDMF